MSFGIGRQASRATWRMFSGESHPLWLRKGNRDPGEQVAFPPLGTLQWASSPSSSRGWPLESDWTATLESGAE